MTATKTGAGLAKWAADIFAAGRHVYWYGTYCNPCNSSLLAGKTNQYPDHYKSNRQPTYQKHIGQKKTCTDCVGLIKGYYWEKDGVIKYRRDSLPDKGANGMYTAAKVKGLIANGMPEIPGLLVWTKTKGHVGVYVGGGEVVEARGFSYGVQRNLMSKRAFTHWGLCPYVEYTADEETLAIEMMSAKPSGTRETLRKGDQGQDVKQMQTLLIASGATLPKHGPDGHFGEETLQALKAYQTANNLTPDGICGPLTWAKLESTGTTGGASGGTGSTVQNPAAYKKPVLHKGSRGDAVEEMQKLLIAKGATLPKYGPDGHFGSETAKALKAYQTANSLTPDGICGPLTWAALMG